MKTPRNPREVGFSGVSFCGLMSPSLLYFLSRLFSQYSKRATSKPTRRGQMKN
ncbi:hypothetical protein D922_01496 [Enterococcus faecalis 06-MB-DW-09]|nr:hypothetical protein D922_01496 [Enterococcus faecalis 06-MB-DW-09]